MLGNCLRPSSAQVSHSEVKEEQVLLIIVILTAILLRNTSAPVLGSRGMLFHSTVSERAFIPAEKSTGSARRQCMFTLHSQRQS